MLRALRYLEKILGINKALFFSIGIPVIFAKYILMFRGHEGKKKILFVKCRIHNLKENDSPPLNNKPTEMLEPAAVTTQKMPFKYMNVKNIGIFFYKTEIIHQSSATISWL